MVAPLIAAALPILGKVIDRAIPDQAEAERVKSTIALQGAELEADLVMSQLELAKEDAKSGKGGFRDMAGKLAIAALAYAWLLQPLLSWASAFVGIDPPPSIDSSQQYAMLTGMLGLGGLRSFDLMKGSRQ